MYTRYKWGAIIANNGPQTERIFFETGKSEILLCRKEIFLDNMLELTRHFIYFVSFHFLLLLYLLFFIHLQDRNILQVKRCVHPTHALYCNALYTITWKYTATYYCRLVFWWIKTTPLGVNKFEVFCTSEVGTKSDFSRKNGEKTIKMALIPGSGNTHASKFPYSNTSLFFPLVAPPPS